MRPDLSREQRIGWSVCGGAIAVAVGLVLWANDWGDSHATLDKERTAIERENAGQPLNRLIARQRQANDALRQTIDRLKTQNGFAIEPVFQVPGSDPTYARQPGKYFYDVLFPATEKLDERRKAIGIVEYDRYLGFGTGPNVPPNRDVPPDANATYLLTMLQLRLKAAVIALQIEPPLDRIAFDQVQVPPSLKQLETGPENRPPLLREWPMTLSVRGSLRSITQLLYRLSQFPSADATPTPAPWLRDRNALLDELGKLGTREFQFTAYPLVTTGFAINSKNRTAKDRSQQLDATFQLAGMQFIADAERGPAAAPSGRGGTGAAGSASAPTGRRPF